MSRTNETILLYDTIFQSFQDLDTAALAESRTIVSRCVSEAGFSTAQLADLTVLNVGTGREAVVFNSLGAGQVHHFDLSARAVESLSEWCTTNGVTSITTRRADICEPGAFGLDAEVDLCYLRGVLHHLEDPATACVNLIEATRPGGVIHFRIYKSGSFFFFVASFARSLVTPADFDRTYGIASTIFADESDPKGKVSETMDHLFVPVLSLWDVDDLDAWFVSRGLTRMNVAPFVSYDHEDLGAASRGVSLYYGRGAEAPCEEDTPPFPGSLCQENDVAYHDDYVCNSIELMGRVREAVGTWDDEARVRFAVACMATAFTWDDSAPQTAEGAHLRFDEVLKGALS